MNSPPKAPTYSILLHPQQEIVARHLRRSEAQGYLERFNGLMNEDAAYAEMIEETNQPHDALTPDTRG